MKRLTGLISTYLLISIALSFSIGIIISQYVEFQAAAVPLLIFLFPAISLCHIKKQNGIARILLLLLFMVLGCLRAELQKTGSTDPNHISNLVNMDQEVILIATIKKINRANQEISRIVFQCQWVRPKDSSDFRKTKGLVLLSLQEQWPQSYLPGDQLAIRTTLNPPSRYNTPGSFDYPAYMARQNIALTGRIRSLLHIHPVSSNPSLLKKIRYIPERIRRQISLKIDNVPKLQQRQLYKALLLGDRSGISPQVLEDFKATGVMHILSVSGLHMSILAMTIMLTLYWLLRRSVWLINIVSVKKAAALFTLPPLIFYTMLAGGNTPVIRSLVMVSVFILALCTDRLKSVYTPIATAAFILLAWNPQDLFTASFQLSFSAVLAISLFSQHGLQWKNNSGFATEPKNWWHRSRLYIGAALLISLAATAGTAPFLLFYFNRISTIGFMTNLFVEPLMCLFSLPIGFATIPLLFVAPDTAAFLLQAGDLGLRLSVWIISICSDLPRASIWLPTPPIWLIVFYLLALVTPTLIFLGRKTFYPLSLLPLGCAVILFILPPGEIISRLRHNNELHFLDIGQGSSTFIILENGERILIDGGGFKSTGFNVGEKIIAPYLWQRGLKSIDSVVITHADGDHYNGIPFILKHFRPKTLWTNGSKRHNEAYRDLIDLAHNLDIAVKTPAENQVIAGNETCSIANLTPSAGKTNNNDVRNISGHHYHLSSNDQSLIIFMKSHYLSCLFPGDISAKRESYLLDNIQLPQPLILLSPHHGSKTSNSNRFLEELSPAYLIVSNSRFKKETFPAPDLKERAGKFGITMMTTADSGTISFFGDNNKDKHKKPQTFLQ